ncbi:hypothetical protein CDAR_46581 [Caerostris darwini]|uniref:Uncharacterized protein n=1 Tax=Caerostris darwini TaxID=1538125 RepID=A0AAV4RXY4_9ARAC|nr:hypothetical protein CDAR_46581 [Caerostris darwini]
MKEFICLVAFLPKVHLPRPEPKLWEERESVSPNRCSLSSSNQKGEEIMKEFRCLVTFLPRVHLPRPEPKLGWEGRVSGEKDTVARHQLQAIPFSSPLPSSSFEDNSKKMKLPNAS